MSTAVFGAPEWKARSGRLVKPREDGTILFGRVNGHLDKPSAMDAEEYFQAKRDAELGRWRWPENPEWIVYPARDGYKGECDLLVVNETWGAAAEYTRAEDDGSPCSASDASRAARAYFEAHPVKVWENGIYIGASTRPESAQIWKLVNGVWRDANGYDLPDFDPDTRDLVRLVVSEPSSQAGLSSIRGGL